MQSKVFFSFFKKYPLALILIRLMMNMTTTISIGYSTLILKCKLRILKCKFGTNLKADGKIIISTKHLECIHIGDHLKINSRFKSNLVGITNPAVFQCIKGGTISIGNYCGLSATVLSARSNITIGSNVKIGANVKIFDHDYHSLDYKKRRDPVLDGENCKYSPIVIGDDVFIGVNSIILKGVNIGPRTIIGAGSVVAIKNIPADSVVYGNPAKIIEKTI